MSMAPLTAALVISSRPLWEQAHACIQNLPVRIALEQNEPSDAEALLDRIEKHRVDVILLEVKGLGIPLEEFIRRAHDTSSQPAVFVLHPEASTQQILEALRAGAREFLYPPLTQTLREAFENLSAARSKGSSSTSLGLGRLVGFLSAKGGCGATTFASHVAPEAARRLGKKVLLADFDLDAGMIRFLLKSKSTWSVRDALDNLHRMDANYWDALISKHGTGLDVIPAPEDLAARRAADPQEIAHLMRFIRSSYALTVVDFGRHYSPAALDSLPELDSLYVLSSMDLDTLEQTRNCVEAIQARGFEASRIKVLINCVPEKTVPDPTSVARCIGIRPVGYFVNDYEALYDAWSEGRMLQGSTKLGRELNILAGSIVASVKGEPAEEAYEKAKVVKQPIGGVKRFFSFLQRSQA
jgi:pilus assembly protein CpaE